MTDFSFTATASCNRCGNYLSNSSDDCAECADEKLQRYHFIPLKKDEDSVETVFAINPVRAWAELHDVVDNVIPYKLYETQQTSVEFARNGFDVTDEDELRMQNI